MPDYLKLLEEVLLKPDVVYNTGNIEQWSEFEKKIGVIFPCDYKKIINRYGTGGIGEFIWFLTPFVDDDNVNFLVKMNKMIESYQTSKQSFPDYYKYDVFPEEGGILPWGYTENGDELYWKTALSSEEWKIVIYESASPDCSNYEMSLSEFLYKLIVKEIGCKIFPDNLFDGNVKYVAVKV